jgi:hypothetical protein
MGTVSQTPKTKPMVFGGIPFAVCEPKATYPTWWAWASVVGVAVGLLFIVL